MTTQNILKQMKSETMEQYIARIRNMSQEEQIEASENQRTSVLARYAGTTKTNNYRRKVYHK